MELEKELIVEMSLDKADFGRKITAKFIMEILQKVATEHADEHDFGYKVLSVQNKAWVLNKIKLEFNRSIAVGEKITFKTWPLAPKHYTADRDYEAYDQSGEKIFKATSVWNLIDLEKRCLCSTDCIKDLKVSYHEKRAFERAEFSRFKLDETFNLEYSKTIRISDLDVNNHVNNTNYLTYALDCLTTENYLKGIKVVEIRYSEELRINDALDLYYKNQENKHYIVGKKSTGETVFYALVETGE